MNALKASPAEAEPRRKASPAEAEPRRKASPAEAEPRRKASPAEAEPRRKASPAEAEPRRKAPHCDICRGGSGAASRHMPWREFNGTTRIARGGVNSIDHLSASAHIRPSLNDTCAGRTCKRLAESQDFSG